MNNNVVGLKVVALSVLLGSAGAQAASITFTDPSTNSDAGITATTTSTGGALAFGGGSVFGEGLGIGNQSALTPVKSGIGAVPSGFGGLGTSFVTSETVTVSFSEEVILDTLILGNWENNVAGNGDRATLNFSGGSSGAGTIDLNGSDGNGGLTDAFDFFVNLNTSLTTFTITPVQGGTNSDGATVKTSFRLNAVEVSEVPLPAAVWLFGSAIAGLGVIGRRRRMASGESGLPA